MNENNKYGTIINEKFSDFSFPDMDTTWPGMKDILDKEMPQNKICRDKPQQIQQAEKRCPASC